MSLVDVNGKPLVDRALVDDLPPWVESLYYRADDDVIAMRVIVPRSHAAIEHVLALEMTPGSCAVLVAQLEVCLNRSETASKVLDVPASESSD